MSSSSAPVPMVRFGVFEANLRSGELRKSGVKIKLHDQPFQILVMLLGRPGELVTREEIRQRLWPGDTFVDFDHSLNNAVNRLREALGDSAENPRFIQTLPRRGYRFIGPLTEQPEHANNIAHISAVPVPDTGLNTQDHLKGKENKIRVRAIAAIAVVGRDRCRGPGVSGS